MTFTHLHLHSDGSPQDGAQTVKQIVSQTVKFGMNAVALTDHGRCGNLLEFYKECKKNNIKPILGYEAYVAPTSRFIKDKVDGHHKTSYHLTLLAKNETGLKNIFKLCSAGWIEGFYYKPRICNELLKTHSEGIIALSGCASGRLSVFLSEGRIEEAKGHIEEMADIFKEDFYIEVQNHGFDWQQSLKTSLFQIAENFNIPIVATQDSHYLTKDDADLHRAICKLAAGDLEFEGNESYFKSEDDMLKMFSDEEKHAVYRTEEIANKCNCEWNYGQTIWPIYELPDNKTDIQYLRELASEGFYKFFGEGTEEYRTRFEYELDIIGRMGFATYFLVVQDFLNWARKNNIPTGPGRGSAAGSLICYCVGITEVDPIKYNLYFERFLNVNRVSLPDVDSDISQEGRKRVIDYVSEKYGQDKVCQIGTYAVFKPRGSLRDFARVLGYDYAVGDELANLIPPDVAGKALTFKECFEAEPKLKDNKYKDVIDLACQAEGIISKTGVHAAGVIISDKSLTDYVPLFRGKHDEIATQFDMHGVEEIGLVKYDFLGLKNLDVIQNTIDLIKETQNIEIDISNINLEDQEVYKNIFCTGRLKGVFQFETSSGFKDLCMQVKPSSIEDLATITSLFRPGPLSSGYVQKYVEWRSSGKPEYLVPELESILNNTAGILVFQEQIMSICVKLAGYTLAEADNMRRIIGKKKLEEMQKEKDKFVSGCIKNHIEENKALELFNNIEGFAKYSFNASHAVAYSIVSYKTAWLKNYYPREFYCALFNSSIGDQDDLVKYFYSAKEEGLSIVSPDVNLSRARFTVNNGSIVFGLVGIKGMSEKTAQHIIDSRPTSGYRNIKEFIKCNIGKSGLSPLALSGALDEVLINEEIERELFVHNIEKIIEYYEKIENWHARKASIEEREQEIQKAVLAGIKPPRRLPKNKEMPSFPELDRSIPDEVNTLIQEKKSLGFYLSGHPLDEYSEYLSNSQTTIERILLGTHKTLEKVTFPAVVFSLEEKRTRKQTNMGIVTLEDKTGRVEATIFPKQWNLLKDYIFEDMVVMVDVLLKIDTSEDPETPSIIRCFVNDIKPITSGTKLDDISLVLSDGTEVSFNISKKTDVNDYKQALSIIKNIKRMGLNAR